MRSLAVLFGAGFVLAFAAALVFIVLGRYAQAVAMYFAVFGFGMAASGAGYLAERQEQKR